MSNGLQGSGTRNPQEGSISPDRVLNLSRKNSKALESGRKFAQDLGYNSLIISSHLTGRTDEVAEFLNGIIQTELNYDHPISRPLCLLLGGETTVNVTGEGLGGRNQDLVLKMVERIRDRKGLLFVSFATDGDDGPTDAAGAVCDSFVYDDAEQVYQIDVQAYITDNDSYHFHQKIDSLIKTGSTGTNVNDIILIMMENQ